MPTAVLLVKAMIFPVVMYGCESWTIKRAEHWRIGAFELMLEKTLESPLDCKEIKSVNCKGNQPWISFEGLMLKLQYFGHLIRRAKSLGKILMMGKIEGKRRRGQQRMRWLDGFTDSRTWVWASAWQEFMGSGSQTWLSDWTETMCYLRVPVVFYLKAVWFTT